MKLHYSIQSTYSQKALLAFYEKGVDFTPVQVSVLDPVASAEYKKTYPLGKIPLLTGDDIFIPESTIIIEYLENEFPVSGTKLIPEDKTVARRVRFKDRVFDLYLNNPIATIFFDSLKPIEKQNPEAVAKAHQTIDVVYGFMEQDLKNNNFASGNEFSMADCAAFAPLFYAQKLHSFAHLPNISAYFNRLMQRKSVQRVLAELLPALEKFNSK
ncbi:glutathione S-transferase family protein [Collimonas sp. NPDC087041]|uniref:glutathione S-transferase family protein n=1 Tax=Collimonas sp. NPDC087041 TaxID=3363960 RepID=UPI0038252FA9